MCEANAYLTKEDTEELIMASVDVLEPRGEDTWRLVGIFGDRKIVKGRIGSMTLVEHEIPIEESV